jgi:hypothetical protein
MEDQVSTGNAAGGRSLGKMIAVAVLVVIAVLAIIAGIIYFAEPAKSLPSILGTITHPASRADAHRPVRGVAALVIGVICLVVAWVVATRGKSPRR